MTDLRPLLARLEEATEGSRELDALIWCEIGYAGGVEPDAAWRAGEPMHPEWIVTARTMRGAISAFPADLSGIARAWNVPRISESIDASLALVEKKLPGAEYEVTTLYGIARATLPLNSGDGSYSSGESKAGSVPIAILSALLRALISNQTDPVSP